MQTEPAETETIEQVAERDSWIERVGAMILASGISFVFDHSDGVRRLEMELRHSGRPSMLERYAQLVARVAAFVEGIVDSDDPNLLALIEFYRSLPQNGLAPSPFPFPQIGRAHV